MNRKTIKYLVSSLILFNCLITAFIPAIAVSAPYANNNSDLLTFYDHKDKDHKHNGLNIFSEENYKYLTSEQKKALLELKKCKDAGNSFNEEQQKTLHTLIDCIIKGKLGDKEYDDFKSLVEKKKVDGNLTEDEDKRLKEYRDIISGTKPTSRDILDQFLR